jgi:predicted ATPase
MSITAPGVKAELFDAVAQSLRRASSHQTLVIVLDDLQWADLTSLELLTFLAGRLSEERVLVLGTVRELDVGRNDELVATLATMTRRAGSRRIRLRGLDAADMNLLLARATGLDVSPAVAAAIHGRAEGNPSYATSSRASSTRTRSTISPRSRPPTSRSGCATSSAAVLRGSPSRRAISCRSAP